jgi:hypothetical protein
MVLTPFSWTTNCPERRDSRSPPGPLERADGLLELRQRGRLASLPPPRLLGPVDPLLMGWTSRDLVLGPQREIVTVNGLFRPFALVRGCAVGTWRFFAGALRLYRSPR